MCSSCSIDVCDTVTVTMFHTPDSCLSFCVTALSLFSLYLCPWRILSSTFLVTFFACSSYRLTGRHYLRPISVFLAPSPTFFLPYCAQFFCLSFSVLYKYFRILSIIPFLLFQYFIYTYIYTRKFWKNWKRILQNIRKFVDIKHLKKTSTIDLNRLRRLCNKVWNIHPCLFACSDLFQALGMAMCSVQQPTKTQLLVSLCTTFVNTL